MIFTQNGPKSIAQVKMHFERGNLFLSPEEYQRESAWTPFQKQLLIDSIFRGMDIPKLYFWRIDYASLLNGYPESEARQLYRDILDRKRRENDDPNPYLFEAVDGQQRIRTIMEFMGVKPPNEHCYRGTWHDPYPSLPDTPKARGKFYSQLSVDQQIDFGQYPLTIMVLESATIEEIRDMFLRLQNGTPLNTQQKRDAMGSHVGRHARDIARMPFFTLSVHFDNASAEHHRVASQMLLLESRDKVVSCTSQQLDKFFEQYKKVDLDGAVVNRAAKIVQVMGKVFPKRNPALNRSYALGLYWAFSRLL